MKVQFQNEFLMILSNHSYSIYLLQRVIMIFIYHHKYFEKSSFIRFIFIFIVVLFMSCIFDKYTFFINELIMLNKHSNLEETYKLL